MTSAPPGAAILVEGRTMEIEVRRSKGVCVLGLSGRLVLGNGDVVLRERFRAALDEGERRFVFDLARLAYVDSAGIGELVACAKRAGEAGAVIRLASPPGTAVHRVLTITQLDRALEVHDDAEGAVAAFA